MVIRRGAVSMADAFPLESLVSHTGLMKSCLDLQEIAKEASDLIPWFSFQTAESVPCLGNSNGIELVALARSTVSATHAVNQ